MAVVVPIVSTFDKSGISDATKGFANLSQHSSKLGSSLKKAFLPAAAAVGALTAGLISASKAAMEDQASQVELARSVKASTKATDKQIAAMEDFITQTSLATGVADDELRPALARLVRGTGNLGKAQGALRLAMDISRATGKSLVTVSDALSKGYKGNLTALSRLSPEVKSIVKGHTYQIKTTNALGKEITKTVKVAGTFDQVLSALNKNYSGASARAAETMQGKWDILKVTMKETKEQIGYALLPALDSVFKVIRDNVLPFVNKLTHALDKDGLAGAFTVAKDEMKNFVQNADGLKGVLVDLTGTVAVFFAAFKGAKGIGGIKLGLDGVKAALANNAKYIGVWASTTSATIAGAFALAFATVYLAIDTLRDKVAGPSLINTFKNVAGAIGNVFVGVINVLAAGFNEVIRVANWLNPLRDIPKLGMVPWLKMDYDTNFYTGGKRSQGTAGGVPKMAKGGIVTKPTIAMVGEAGPEAVIPLNRVGAMGGVNITVQAGVGDPVAIGKSVVDALVAYQRRSGSLPIKVA